ncbi:TolC family protein [Sediminibacterium roseum]|uniref:TolC family protein n=1 Tax=Sediminibacterium roseum TaxID=1978412 RepID=A0ABX0A1Q7_9BACT|nr:TolC family protein [Sediminibacterium roseum]NCI51882.1 TolC family protein [Sediminibacterium roseum]
MKKKQSTRIASLLCMLLVTLSVTAQQRTTHEFTIQQAVEYAHAHNVQVKNALLAIESQKQTNREITAQALPNITGSANLTKYIDIPTSLIPGEVFGQPAGTYIPVQFGTKYNSTASVQLQQTLFDGQVFVGLQARKTSIDFQTKNAEVTEEAIKTNIYKIYYQLVVSKTQIDLLDANIARLEKLEHDATELFKNGFAEKLDIDKVSVQLANLRTEKLKAQNSISIGYLGLKTLIGMPVKDSLVLVDKIDEQQIREDFSNDTAYNYADRKEFQLLSLNKKLNEFNIKRYQLSYIPTLSLTGNYAKNAQRNTFDFFAKGGQWFTTSFIGLNLSVPIFDGFARNARIKRSRIELKQTENQIDNLKLSIDNDVEAAKISFKSAMATMDFQKKNMQLAETVYNQTKKKFEAGTGSNTEITAAQTDLVTAQTNYINSLYSAIIAKVDYLKATGKL